MKMGRIRVTQRRLLTLLGLNPDTHFILDVKKDLDSQSVDFIFGGERGKVIVETGVIPITETHEYA